MDGALKDNILTINFLPDEMEVLNWISQTYGQNELNNLIWRFLVQRKAQMDETKKGELWDKLKAHPDLIETAISEADKRA